MEPPEGTLAYLQCEMLEFMGEWHAEGNPENYEDGKRELKRNG